MKSFIQQELVFLCKKQKTKKQMYSNIMKPDGTQNYLIS